MKVFERKEYGIIGFGRFIGDKWNDLPRHYLEYLCSEDCLTSDENKKTAGAVLKQKGICDGQIEMF